MDLNVYFVYLIFFFKEKKKSVNLSIFWVVLKYYVHTSSHNLAAHVQHV